MARRRPGRGAFLSLSILAAVAAGCTEPARGWDRSSGSADAAPVESNIVGVRKFISSNPWLIFNSDGTGRVDGLKVMLYLEGTKEPKGVFGTGTIVVTLYRVDQDPAGGRVARQVFEREFPPDKAYPWRRKRATGMGWGYGLRLPWGKDLDLSGQNILIVVKYVQENGRVVASAPQELLVPEAKYHALKIEP
ncbi:MAG: hypothetical protein ACE5F9_04895 [Phycisphaerae bacterium]